MPPLLRRARVMPPQEVWLPVTGPSSILGFDVSPTHQYVELNGNCIGTSHDCGTYPPGSTPVPAPVAEAVGDAEAAGEVGDDAASDSPSLFANGVDLGGAT
jgi:hypothetical protein